MYKQNWNPYVILPILIYLPSPNAPYVMNFTWNFPVYIDIFVIRWINNIK